MTEPYTPSLDEVREAFSEMSSWDMNAGDADAAFDRFIAQVRAETIREAGRLLRGPDNPQRKSDYRRESYVMDDAGYQLFGYADRIERGEQ